MIDGNLLLISCLVLIVLIVSHHGTSIWREKRSIDAFFVLIQRIIAISNKYELYN